MEANGIECFECTAITADEQAAFGVVECADCGEADAVGPVRIEACPNDARTCTDDDHHFGRGDHVTTIRR